MEDTSGDKNSEKGNELKESGALEPVILQDRDIQVFKMIHEQRFLAHSHIKRAFWPDRSELANTCYHRIERLREEDWIRHLYSSRKKLKLHLITEKSLEELRKRGLDSGVPLYVPGTLWQRSVDHDLKVSTIRIVLRELGLDSWTSERLLRERNVPGRIADGVLNIGGHKVAVEFENFLSKSKPDFAELLRFYRSHSEYAVVLVILYGPLREWLLDLDYDAEQVFFANYKDLLWWRGRTRFENKGRTFVLEEIL